MEKLFNKVTWGMIAISSLLVVLGIILLLIPDVSLVVIGYLIAAILIAGGAYSIFFGYKDVLGIKSFDSLTSGIVSIILGILIFFKPIALATLIPIILGIWFIATGAFRTRISLALKKLDDDMWLVTLLMALLTIICGILLIVNPLDGIIVLAQMIGILTIIYAIADIIDIFIFRAKVDKFKKLIK